MKLLGIDYGDKRTGLAIGDSQDKIAVDFSTITTVLSDVLVDEISATIASEGIDQVVVGLPLSLDGSETAQTLIVKKFAEKLAEAIHVPVVFEDERLSSKEFEKLSRKERQAKGLDALSAMTILQSYIDKMK
ncbi:MAG TPA: Holliday junction resolvase RuvX [Patescibacteria group bacterium]|nr:Holliday junction resolvase RuvX [Patescibacteria group bacterium]